MNKYNKRVNGKRIRKKFSHREILNAIKKVLQMRLNRARWNRANLINESDKKCELLLN